MPLFIGEGGPAIHCKPGNLPWSVVFRMGGMNQTEAEISVTDDMCNQPRRWRGAGCLEQEMKKFMAGLAFLLTVGASTQAQETDEIIVSATGIPTPAAQIGASVDVITAADLEAQQITYLQDALKLKGINVPQSGGVGTLSNVFLRGLPGKYTTLVVDGIDMFDSGSNQVLWNDVTTDGVGQVEILRGSQGVLYGSNTIAGVISQFTAIGGETQNKVRVERGEMATERLVVSGKGQKNNIDYGYAVSNFSTDGISASSIPATGSTSLEDDAYENLTLNSKLRARLSDIGHVELVFRQSTGDLEKDGIAGDLAGSTEEFERTSFRLSFDAEFGNIHHHIGVTDYDATIEDFSGPNNTGDRLSSREALDYRMIYGVSDNLQLVLGAADETISFENTSSDFSAFAKASVDTSGFYGLAQWQPSESLNTTFALRQDDHDLFGTHSTYRATVSYLLNNETVLRANIGSGYRAPSLSELYLAFYGNPDLEPETSFSSEIGFDMKLNNQWAIGVTAFAIEVEDVIGYDNAFKNIQIAGTSEISGLELVVDWALSDSFSAAIDLAYTDSEKPAASGSGLMEREVRVPRSQAGIVLDYRANDRLNLGANIRVVRNTRDVGNVQLDDYTLVDLRATCQLTERYESYIRLQNAFDEDYEVVNGFGTAERAVYFGLTADF